MPHTLISHSPDLKRLWDEGFELEIRGAFLLIHHVPYVNQKIEIKYGILVTSLELAGDRTVRPGTHVIHFIGEDPCNKDGSIIKQIQYSGGQNLGDITVNRSFSNKPPEDYSDYYEKVTQYVNIISGPAKSLDNSVTEKTYQVIESSDSNSVFNYPDTNSARAEINSVTKKLENQKVAIIGLGGTGSYILDLIAKTPVQEIHLYDGDTFLQHNAFRAPGAPSIQKLRERMMKTDYLKQIYMNMHKNIVSHTEFIHSGNIDELMGMNFVFICFDKGQVKKKVTEFLEKRDIQFIDVGMGIEKADDELIGILRVTTSSVDKRDHIMSKGRIPFLDDYNNEYSNNIQIADLNALNASLAVIKWKKLYDFYQDLEKEHFSTYSINENQLLSDDTVS